MEIQKLYTVKEVSELISVGPATIKNWIKAGRLEAIKMGQAWRFTEEMVQDLIKNGVPDNPKPAKEKIDIIAAAQSIFEGSDKDAKGQT